VSRVQAVKGPKRYPRSPTGTQGTQEAGTLGFVSVDCQGYSSGPRDTGGTQGTQEGPREREGSVTVKYPKLPLYLFDISYNRSFAVHDMIVSIMRNGTFQMHMRTHPSRGSQYRRHDVDADAT
jgi:hypothetical protein